MEIETQSYITNLLKTNPKIVENNLNYNDKKFNKKRILYLNLENLKDVPNFNIKEYIDVFLKDVNEAYPTVKNKVFIFVDELQYSKKLGTFR